MTLFCPKFKYLNSEKNQPFWRDNCYLRCWVEPDPDLLHKWFQLGDKPVRQSLPEFGLHGKIPEVPRDIHRFPIDTHLPKTMLRRLRLVQLPRVYWLTSRRRLISTWSLTPFISIFRSVGTSPLKWKLSAIILIKTTCKSWKASILTILSLGWICSNGLERRKICMKN